MLFLIVLRYIRPLAEVEEQLSAHRAYLQRHYASGHFLLSGRQEPRIGGVILLRAADRASAERIVVADPFIGSGVAEAELIEWAPSLRADEVPAHWVPDAVLGDSRPG